jgi:hypothetical protein
MSDDHKRGHSKNPGGSFAKAADDAVQRYEAWCRQHGKTPEKDKDIEVEFCVQLGNSLSEYIAILHIDD